LERRFEPTANFHEGGEVSWDAWAWGGVGRVSLLMFPHPGQGLASSVHKRNEQKVFKNGRRKWSAPWKNCFGRRIGGGHDS